MNQDKSPKKISVSEVFDAVWSEVCLVLGATMAASLFRRVIAECDNSCGKLSQVSIRKDGINYVYYIPPEIENDPDAYAELPKFVNTLLLVLSRISGDVLVVILLKNRIIREIAGKEWLEHG